VPHIYPFIVNDPGEGTQAKRRTSAVIIDHLTPPLTRAESYGPLKDLEALVDEYYEASGVDPRRLKLLTREILDLVRDTGSIRCRHRAGMTTTAALEKLDAICAISRKCRSATGCIFFGESPDGDLLTDAGSPLPGCRAATGRAMKASLSGPSPPISDCQGLRSARLRSPRPWTGARPGR
jgi:cobaltochelatase CobN